VWALGASRGRRPDARYPMVTSWRQYTERESVFCGLSAPFVMAALPQPSMVGLWGFGYG
jgi:hypothetical protein